MKAAFRIVAEIEESGTYIKLRHYNFHKISTEVFPLTPVLTEYGFQNQALCEELAACFGWNDLEWFAPAKMEAGQVYEIVGIMKVAETLQWSSDGFTGEESAIDVELDEVEFHLLTDEEADAYIEDLEEMEREENGQF